MKPTARAASVRHALEHGAGGEFSAIIRPSDCSLLLSIFDHYYELLEERHGRIRGLRDQAQRAEGN